MTGTPDFVVVGNIVRDVIPGGYRLGGTPTFAAAQAHRLGLTVGVVTRAPADFDPSDGFDFAQIARGDSSAWTVFENTYTPQGRVQRLLSRASAIEPGDIPDAWRSAPIVLLGPVFHEIPDSIARHFSSSSLVGVSAQGWLRAIDDAGRVRHAPWTGEPFWAGASAIFASVEDLAGEETELARWTSGVSIVAVTRSHSGARLHADGRWREMDAFPEEEVDATGAGDTFATGFLVRYRETGDPNEAARFGAAAASLSVAGIGASAMGTRAEIEARMRQHPEIALR
ncbi:MAG: ribokinase [Chloroflexi bacterium]|nr:ribokinase [Chloroflexota bacterium]